MVNQALPEKTCGIPCKFWFFGMIAFNILVMLLIFINLVLQDWIYQGEDHTQFKGNLTHLYETGAFWSEDSYSTVAEDLGDKADEYLDDSFNQEFYEEYQNKFNADSLAGILLIVFAVLSLICFGVTLAGYFVTFVKTNLRVVSTVAATLGGVFFCLGSILYLGISFADFGSECEDLIESEEEEVVLVRSCRGGAAYFLIVNIVLVLVFSIMTCSIMSCGLKEKLSYEGVKTDSRDRPAEPAKV